MFTSGNIGCQAWLARTCLHWGGSHCPFVVLFFFQGYLSQKYYLWCGSSLEEGSSLKTNEGLENKFTCGWCFTKFQLKEATHHHWTHIFVRLFWFFYLFPVLISIQHWLPQPWICISAQILLIIKGKKNKRSRMERKEAFQRYRALTKPVDFQHRVTGWWKYSIRAINLMRL